MKYMTTSGNKYHRRITAALIKKTATTQSCKASFKETGFSSWWWSCILRGRHYRWSLIVPLSWVRISILGVTHLGSDSEEKWKRGKRDLRERGERKRERRLAVARGSRNVFTLSPPLLLIIRRLRRKLTGASWVELNESGARSGRVEGAGGPIRG